MATRDEIDVLIGRVEGLSGPDSVVDVAVYEALARFTAHEVPPYTASLDAVLALAKRVLPGWSAVLYIHPKDAFADVFKVPADDPPHEGHCYGRRDPAVALLLAVLRAYRDEAVG